MKKRFSILLSVLLVFSLVLAACGGGGNDAANEGNNEGESANNGGGDATDEGQTYHWRFITEELDGQVQYEYAQEFAKRMEQKSDGKIKIDVYEYGGLGSEVDQVEQLQAGAVELAIVSPGFTGGMVKAGQVFTLHFLLPSEPEKAQEVLNTSEALNETLAGMYEEHNILPLAFWTEGAMAWTANKAIHTPDDFKNFKMRTQNSPLMLESYKAYGANPTAMSWSELYTSLEKDIVEGQENPVFFIEDAKFNEVQDYLIISNHNNYVAMTTVNPTWYRGLPDDVRALIDETVDELRPWVFDLQKEENEKRIGMIEENTEYPTEIIELTEEERDLFREKAVPVRDFFVNEVVDEEGKQMFEQLVEDIKAVE